MLGLDLLRYSQQWQASDIFRVAPMNGPASLCHGARRAVLCVLTLPALLVFGTIAWLLPHGGARLSLLLPGLILVPIYALIPCRSGKAVPLSLPAEGVKAAGRAFSMIGVMFVSMAVSGLGLWAWSGGWFLWLLLVELAIVASVYVLLRRSIRSVCWQPIE